MKILAMYAVWREKSTHVSLYTAPTLRIEDITATSLTEKADSERKCANGNENIQYNPHGYVIPPGRVAAPVLSIVCNASTVYPSSIQ
jgi:hypothetical protein